jgi:hypothetical protein
MHEALIQECARRNARLIEVNRRGYRVEGGWSVQVRMGQLQLVYELFCPRCGRGCDPGFERWLEPDHALASEMDAAERQAAEIYIKYLGYQPARGCYCPHLLPYLEALSRGEMPPKVERTPEAQEEIAEGLKRLEGETAPLDRPRGSKPPT